MYGTIRVTGLNKDTYVLRTDRIDYISRGAENNIDKKVFDDTECIYQYVKLFRPIKHQCTDDTIGVADIVSFKIKEVNSNDN